MEVAVVILAIVAVVVIVVRIWIRPNTAIQSHPTLNYNGGSSDGCSCHSEIQVVEFMAKRD